MNHIPLQSLKAEIQKMLDDKSLSYEGFISALKSGGYTNSMKKAAKHHWRELRGKGDKS